MLGFARVIELRLFFFCFVAVLNAVFAEPTLNETLQRQVANNKTRLTNRGREIGAFREIGCRQIVLAVGSATHKNVDVHSAHIIYLDPLSTSD
jgi:hypothetical protein